MSPPSFPGFYVVFGVHLLPWKFGIFLRTPLSLLPPVARGFEDLFQNVDQPRYLSYCRSSAVLFVTTSPLPLFSAVLCSNRLWNNLEGEKYVNNILNNKLLSVRYPDRMFQRPRYPWRLRSIPFGSGFPLVTVVVFRHSGAPGEQ